jgi:uridine phosphorylase
MSEVIMPKYGKDHLGIGTAQLTPIALLPGDPARVFEIASQWDSCEEVGGNREYLTITGSYKGLKLTACSTGMGSASTEVAMIELFQHGVRNFIRVGTSGGLGPAIDPGDLIIVSGAVRYSGAADAYVPANYPAVAHHEMVLALIEAAESPNYRYHVGIGLSLDSFYATKTKLIRGTAFPSEIESELSKWISAGVLQLDMETAIIFILATMLGAKAGAICTAGSNLLKQQFAKEPLSNLPAIEVANEAATLINLWNTLVKRPGHYFYPSLITAVKEE